MQELQQSYEQKLAAVSERVNDLQKEINTVKNKPVQEVIGGQRRIRQSAFGAIKAGIYAKCLAGKRRNRAGSADGY